MRLSRLPISLCLLLSLLPISASAKGKPVSVTVVSYEVIQQAKTITVPPSGVATTNCVQLENGNVIGYPQGGGMIQMSGTTTCRTIVPQAYTASALSQSGFLYAEVDGQHVLLYAKPSVAAAMAKGALVGAGAGAGSTTFEDGAARGGAASRAAGPPLGKMLPIGQYNGELNGSHLAIYYVRPFDGKLKKAKYEITATW